MGWGLQAKRTRTISFSGPHPATQSSLPFCAGVQAAVVQKVDNAIHRINHYPVDSVVCFVNTYPLDSDLSGV